MNEPIKPPYRIAVVIPCYKVRRHVLQVVSKIGDTCWRIYAVDDACPEKSGQLLAEKCGDPRLRILYHEQNRGVGSAVMSGYRQAIADGAQIIVKIDGDGQADPALLPDFVAPLIAGQAGNPPGN